MLTLICGLPRAGKTTYSQQFEGTCKVIHLDKYGGGNIAHYRCNDKVETDEDVVVEGIYNRAGLRKCLICKYKGQYKRCIWLDTSIEVKKTRHGYRPSCEFSFEPPSYDEGWDEIIIIRDGEEILFEKE